MVNSFKDREIIGTKSITLPNNIIYASSIPENAITLNEIIEHCIIEYWIIYYISCQ